MTTNDVALVCGDGGIKGGFIAGAVSALLEDFPEVMENLSVVAATSASVGSMFYFLSHGKNHPGLNIWTKELASKEFMEFKGARSFLSPGPLYNIHYMADVIFKDRHPLNVDRVMKCKTEFYVSVQNYDSCRLEYFSNRPDTAFERSGIRFKIKSMRDIDVYELIKATNSAPFVFDQTTTLNGEEYIDSATLEPFILDFPALKGKKKIVILTKSRNRARKSLAYCLSGYLWPFLVSPLKSRKFKREVYFQYARKPVVIRRMFDALEMLQQYDRTVVISPTSKLGRITDNKEETLRSNYEQGFRIAKSMRTRVVQLLEM